MQAKFKVVEIRYTLRSKPGVSPESTDWEPWAVCTMVLSPVVCGDVRVHGSAMSWQISSTSLIELVCDSPGVIDSFELGQEYCLELLPVRN